MSQQRIARAFNVADEYWLPFTMISVNETNPKDFTFTEDDTICTRWEERYKVKWSVFEIDEFM